MENIQITKEELIVAMQKYNQDVVNNREKFDEIDNSKECAVSQVEYLLKLVEENRSNN